MNMEMLVGSLVGNSPPLVFWIAVLIFGIVLLKRGGGRAERFLIAGAGVKLAAVILGIPLTNITFWLIREGYSAAYRDSVATGYSVFLDILGMVGVICLIYAFWVKFKATESDRELALLQN